MDTLLIRVSVSVHYGKLLAGRCLNVCVFRAGDVDNRTRDFKKNPSLA